MLVGVLSCLTLSPTGFEFAALFEIGALVNGFFLLAAILKR